MTKLTQILKENQAKFRPSAYTEYTPSMLAGAVGFFATRATHRVDIKKTQKDLDDAQNYLWMLRKKTIG